LIVTGRLAVDRRHCGRGLGTGLLKHFVSKALEVAQSIGVRVLLIHKKDDQAKTSYRHFGFIESPLDPFVLMVLLADVS